jgi:hypothetical protein
MIGETVPKEMDHISLPKLLQCWKNALKVGKYKHEFKVDQ